MDPTRTGSDEEAVEDVWVGQVGCDHCEVNLVGAVCQFWCLEVDNRSGGIKPWLLGTSFNAKLGKHLTKPFFRGGTHKKTRQSCNPRSDRKCFALPSWCHLLGHRRATPETLFP